MVFIKNEHIMRDMWLQKFILPYTCYSCHKQIEARFTFCSDCWQQLSFILNPQCVTCGWPFEFQQAGVNKCASCLFRSPPYTKGRAAVRYNEMAKQIILRLKYGDQEELVPVMSRFMANAFEQLQVTNPLFVPVPLHYFRLVKRRFNQASLLAKELAKSYGEFAPQVLKRKKYTPSQGHKTKKQRQSNVKNVFQLYKTKSVTNKDIVLVDDVFTTGATINESCKELLKSDAKSINVLTFARVIKASAIISNK